MCVYLNLQMAENLLPIHLFLCKKYNNTVWYITCADVCLCVVRGWFYININLGSSFYQQLVITVIRGKIVSTQSLCVKHKLNRLQVCVYVYIHVSHKENKTRSSHYIFCNNIFLQTFWLSFTSKRLNELQTPLQSILFICFAFFIKEFIHFQYKGFFKKYFLLHI